MLNLLWNLANGRLLLAALLGTGAQVGLGFANSQNLAGIGDLIAGYGLGGQLASGGLVAVLVGLIYTLTATGGGGAIGTSSGGALAGGLSGTLGLAVSQALGVTPVEAGATPILDFPAIGAYLQNLIAADPGTLVSLWDLSDEGTLGATFGATAAGGGIGAFVARRLGAR